MYLTVVNSALGLSEKSGREFCEPDSDANQFRQGSSILKHAGLRGTAPQIYMFFSISAKSWMYYKRGKYKINHISKIKNHTKKTHEIRKALSDRSGSFLLIWPLVNNIFLRIFCNLFGDNNSKTKNRKNMKYYFSFVTARCASFM